MIQRPAEGTGWELTMGLAVGRMGREQSPLVKDKVKGRLPEPIIKWEPQLGARETAVLPFSTPINPLQCELIQSIRCRSSGQWRWRTDSSKQRWRVQVQTCHESQAVNQKWQGIVFTLLLNSRNHCTVGHSYLCNSIPSALPMLTTLLHTDLPFLDLYRMKCSSPASLCGWLLPSFRSQFVAVLFCFL